MKPYPPHNIFSCPNIKLINLFAVDYVKEMNYLSKKSPNVESGLLCFLWYHPESNQGHTDFQSVALPTELWYLIIKYMNVCGTTGIIHGFSVRCSTSR